MVPEGWKRIPIKDACEAIIDCVNKTAPVVDYETNFKMLRTTNVRNGRVNTQDVRYVTEETYLQWVKRGKPQKGDIIFTREAPVGEAGVLEEDNGVFLGQRTVMYRAKNDLADNYYLFYSLSSEYCQKQIDNFSNGGTVAHMRVPDCGEILINFPPLTEQKKIAQILSTWDKAIATTEQLLANSQHQKKTLMQKLFSGKSRFSNFDDKFRYRFFYELLNIDSKNLGGETSGDYLFDYISLSDVKSGRINDHLERHFFKDAPSRARRILTEGDILFSTVRPNLQGFAKVGENHKECIASTGFSILTPKDKVCGNYIYHYLYSSHITAQINTLVVGTNYPAINSSDVARLRIYCPGYEEQKRIARVLDNCDKDIEALNHKLFLLKQEKKALMQQLLTGKRRVKVDAA